MQRAIRYPFTHDIRALIELAAKAGLPLSPDAQDLPYLTPFGTLFRYEEEEWGLPESVNADRMLGWAETTVAWARSITSLES